MCRKDQIDVNRSISIVCQLFDTMVSDSEPITHRNGKNDVIMAYYERRRPFALQRSFSELATCVFSLVKGVFSFLFLFCDMEKFQRTIPNVRRRSFGSIRLVISHPTYVQFRTNEREASGSDTFYYLYDLMLGASRIHYNSWKTTGSRL